MGIITEFKTQKCKTRANVYLDGRFVCGLELQTIIKNGLKLGTEISAEKLQKIQVESEQERAYEKALSLVERQKYTKVALSRKLKEKGFVDDVVSAVLLKLESYGYISDENFALSYISVNPTKSKREIENKLIQKGINKEVVKTIMEEQGVLDDEQNKCDAAAEKYMRGKERNSTIAKKLMAHLVYKGFGFGNASVSVKKYAGEDLNIDD